MVGTITDLEAEEQADYRSLTVSGNHYSLGSQLAQVAAGSPVNSLTPEQRTQIASLMGVSVEQVAALDPAGHRRTAEQPALNASQLAFAEDCLELVCNYHPPLLDEFEGYAKELGISLTSLLGALTFGTEQSPRHCSAFAWRGRDGVTVGRNFDFFPWVKTRHLIHAEPEIYYATVGMNDGHLGGRHEGVNELGLFVALSAVPTGNAAPSRPGVIFHLVPRILLETCASAGEAMMLARDMPHLTSHAYLVADPDEMFVVEAHPDLVRVREPENGCIAATNHFLHSDLQNLVQSPVQENSKQRQTKMLSSLSEAADGSDPWMAAKDILIDHEAPLCSHGESMATLWSMVADLTNKRLAYSLGAPCRNEYQMVPWPGTSNHILSGRSRT
jgi:predicted choloylglycine hydrolase